MVTYLAIAKLCKLRAQQWDCDGIRSTPTDPNTHPNLGNFESLNGEEVFDKRRGWSRASRRLREDTERSGVPDPPLTRRINQIANYTLVEWADNIDISDDPPTSYVPDYESKFTTSHGARRSPTSTRHMRCGAAGKQPATQTSSSNAAAT